MIANLQNLTHTTNYWQSAAAPQGDFTTDGPARKSRNPNNSTTDFTDFTDKKNPFPIREIREIRGKKSSRK
jgi:hypothetical protein